jgi:YfiH family protein
MAANPTRTGGEILAANLIAQGATHAFCVPGASFLALLDALYDVRDRIELVVCRQEGGAAFMAEACGKMTGRPGVAIVTRGPGASNAAIVNGSGKVSVPSLRFCRSAATERPDTPLMTFSADCPLILAVDPRRRVFGTAHASWRGTVAHIAMELVEQLRANFKVRPNDLLVGIGPCAGPDEYEVGDVVRRIAVGRLPGASRFFPAKGEKWCFNLRAANVAQLIDAGIRLENIAIASASTIADPRFFSHRRDGADTGRFALIAGFKQS